MKKLALILALLTLISCMVLSVSADAAELDAQEAAADEYSVSLFGMNSLMNDAGSNGAISLDTENQVAGSGCNSAVIGKAGEGFTLRKNSVGTVNASAFEFIEFEFYVSDASILSKWDKFDHTSFEMTSSGTYDKNELGWTFAELLAANEGGEVKAGWNHIKVKLSTGHPDNDKDAGIDLSNVKFFRIYMANPHEDINVTVKFDNVRFTNTAPEPVTEAPATDAPATDAPATAAPATNPTDDPAPTTFDASASIAVAAVAAMGIVLVSSKKRH